MMLVEHRLPKEWGRPREAGWVFNGSFRRQFGKRNCGRFSFVEHSQNINQVLFRGRFIKRNSDGSRIEMPKIHPRRLRSLEDAACFRAKIKLDRIKTLPRS